jgi:hypothetical protein
MSKGRAARMTGKVFRNEYEMNIWQIVCEDGSGHEVFADGRWWNPRGTWIAARGRLVPDRASLGPSKFVFHIDEWQEVARPGKRPSIRRPAAARDGARRPRT